MLLLQPALLAAKALCRPVYVPLWKAYRKLGAPRRVAAALCRPDCVLVHQMGKVGSQSVVASLEALGVAVFHTHFLTAEGIEWVNRHMTRNGQDPRPVVADWILINQAITRGQYHRPLKVVTLVRDPVARNVSGFFYTRVRASGLDLADPRLVDVLLDEFLEDEYYPSDVPLTWLDREIWGLFGVDLYAQPFPKERGYVLCGNDRATVLCLTLEKLNDCAAEAFREFLGVDGFTLVTTNTAEEMPYRDVYKAFQKRLKLSPDYLDCMYSSRLVTHFYTAQEVERFRARWS